MQRGAVGRSDEHGSHLRVVMHFLFQHLQVQALGVERTLDRQLHIGQQRPAIGVGPALFEIAR
ncbi:hypothetical protein D3C76_1023240 [compost metagenome]